MLRRLLDLINKAWTYQLTALERPRELPTVIWLATIEHVHLGELLKLSRYKSWFKAADIETVLDVGAHTGEFASAIRIILPKAQIYSFEPLSDCYQRMLNRFAKDKRFQAFCVALGDQRGQTNLWRSSSTKSSSVLPMNDFHKRVFPWTAQTTHLTVQMETLDNYVGKLELARKALLKIDVQGYEYRVLQGGQQILKQVDYVLVEVSFKPLYKGQASFDDVYNLLVAEGFEYAGNLDQLLSPVDETILQADTLFVRTL